MSPIEQLQAALTTLIAAVSTEATAAAAKDEQIASLQSENAAQAATLDTVLGLVQQIVAALVPPTPAP